MEIHTKETTQIHIRRQDTRALRAWHQRRVRTPRSQEDAQIFFKACQSTGSIGGCAFYDSDSTCGKMTKRYTATEEALAAHPIQMTAPQGTYNLENFKADVFGMMSGGAGSPTYLWPFLAAFLADVENVTKGNPPGAAFNQVYQQGFAPRYVSPPVDDRQQGPTDAQQGIPCTDSGPLVITQKQFETRLSSFTRKDPYFGTVFLQQYLACSGKFVLLHFEDLVCCRRCVG